LIREKQYAATQQNHTAKMAGNAEEAEKVDVSRYECALRESKWYSVLLATFV
jgi:hypothetical protein